MNKTEMNLMNKVMEGSIELKMSLYKALGEDLVKIQNELAELLGNKEVKYVAPVTPVVPEHKESTEREIQEEKVINTILGKDVKEGQIVLGYCGSCCEPTKQYRNKAELVCLQCKDRCELITNEEYEPTEEYYKEQPKTEVKEQKKERYTKKYNSTNSMVKCGQNEGPDEIVYINKKDKHLYYGQVRLNNEVHNFQWSDEMKNRPLIYGMKDENDMNKITNLLKERLADKFNACTNLNPKDPESANFDGRYNYDVKNNSFIYLTKDNSKEEDLKEDDIIYQGYIKDHAFTVRRDGLVLFRKYDYIFMNKPFEKTPSKNYTITEEEIGNLIESALNHFEEAKANAKPVIKDPVMQKDLFKNIKKNKTQETAKEQCNTLEIETSDGGTQTLLF